MKICIISQNIQTLGGLQVAVTSIAQQLSCTGMAEITFLMPKSKAKPYFPLPAGVNIKVLEDIVPAQNQIYKRIMRTLNRNTGCFDFSIATPMMERMLFSKKSIDRLVAFINEQNFDWVIGTAFNYSLLVAILANRVNCKTAGWMHSTFQGYYGIRGVAYYGLQWLNKKYLSRLDICFVLNERDKQAFMEHYQLNAVVLHNPIAIKTTQKGRHKKGELLFVGRINKQVKGLDYLVDIMKQLDKGQPNDFHLTIVGTGSDEDWLKSEFQRSSLASKVTFTGFQGNVIPYYERSYILLSTSRWEGFGMTILEAMSRGTPCVSFDNDGAHEIIQDGKGGVLIPRYNVDTFVQKIRMIWKDDSAWKLMSRAAVERANAFETNVIAKQMYELLRTEGEEFEFAKKN